MKKQYERELDKLDRNEMLLSSRVGYIISFFFIIISITVYEMSMWVYSTDTMRHISLYQHIIFDGILFTIGIIILILINRKYWKDLRAGKKIVEVNNIEYKEEKKDYEVGSGMRIGKMKAFQEYSIIVDRRRYKIPQGLRIQLEDGGKVAKHFGLHNKYLIKFDTLKRSGIH